MATCQPALTARRRRERERERRANCSSSQDRLDSGVHAHRGSGRESGARGRRGGVGAVRGAPGQGLTLLLKVMWLTHACVMAACSSVATSSDWLRSSS